MIYVTLYFEGLRQTKLNGVTKHFNYSNLFFSISPQSTSKQRCFGVCNVNPNNLVIDWMSE